MSLPNVTDHAINAGMNINYEMWKPVAGFENRYEVSSFGRVRGIGPRNRGIKTPHVTANYYHQYSLYVRAGQKPRSYLVHVLVAEAFLGPRPIGYFVCHNDGNAQNNRLDNLRYDTPAGNSRDRVLHGNSLPGELNHQAILTDDAVRRIRALKGTQPYRHIARQFGVSFTTIQKVMSGEGWRHVS